MAASIGIPIAGRSRTLLAHVRPHSLVGPLVRIVAFTPGALEVHGSIPSGVGVFPRRDPDSMLVALFSQQLWALDPPMYSGGHVPHVSQLLVIGSRKVVNVPQGKTTKSKAPGTP